MSSISSLKDLDSLISASPACLRVLKLGKNVVFKSILQRAIPRETFPLSLAACAAPRIETTEPPGSLPTNTDGSPFRHAGSARRKEVEEGLKELLQDYVSTDSAEHDPDVWARLFKLCKVVDTFIIKFAQDSIQQVQVALIPPEKRLHTNSRDSTAVTPALSDTERGRLQRAFFRFELYRKLFMAGRLIYRWDASDIGRALHKLIIEPLPPWEQEELCCVYSFLYGPLRTTFDEMEDLLAARIEHAIKVEEERSRSVTSQAPVSSTQSPPGVEAGMVVSEAEQQNLTSTPENSPSDTGDSLAADNDRADENGENPREPATPQQLVSEPDKEVTVAEDNVIEEKSCESITLQEPTSAKEIVPTVTNDNILEEKKDQSAPPQAPYAESNDTEVDGPEAYDAEADGSEIYYSDPEDAGVDDPEAYDSDFYNSATQDLDMDESLPEGRPPRLPTWMIGKDPTMRNLTMTPDPVPPNPKGLPADERRGPPHYPDDPTQSLWCMDMCGLSMFQEEERGDRGMRVEALTALGLPFLKHLWTLEPAQKSSVIVSCACTDCGEQFDFAFLSSRRVSRQIPNADAEAELARPGAGWLWQRQFDLEGQTTYHLPGRDTARLGLVFWDEERLQELGVLDKSMRGIRAAAAEPHREERPSVEERFKGASVPWKALVELCPPYLTSSEEWGMFAKLEY